jgi:hypothetical protein
MAHSQAILFRKDQELLRKERQNPISLSSGVRRSVGSHTHGPFTYLLFPFLSLFSC